MEFERYAQFVDAEMSNIVCTDICSRGIDIPDVREASVLCPHADGARRRQTKG